MVVRSWLGTCRNRPKNKQIILQHHSLFTKYFHFVILRQNISSFPPNNIERTWNDFSSEGCVELLSTCHFQEHKAECPNTFNRYCSIVAVVCLLNSVPLSAFGIKRSLIGWLVVFLALVFVKKQKMGALL